MLYGVDHKSKSFGLHVQEQTEFSNLRGLSGLIRVSLTSHYNSKSVDNFI